MYSDPQALHKKFLCKHWKGGRERNLREQWHQTDWAAGQHWRYAVACGWQWALASGESPLRVRLSHSFPVWPVLSHLTPLWPTSCSENWGLEWNPTFTNLAWSVLSRRAGYCQRSPAEAPMTLLGSASAWQQPAEPGCRGSAVPRFRLPRRWQRQQVHGVASLLGSVLLRALLTSWLCLLITLWVRELGSRCDCATAATAAGLERGDLAMPSAQLTPATRGAGQPRLLSAASHATQVPE